MTSFPDFQYIRPKSLDELLSHLSQYGDDAAILAGGTDLVPRIKMCVKPLKVMISLSSIDGLAFVHHIGETLRIGAKTTIDELQHHPAIGDHPALHEATLLTASENLRLKGTVGGNIMQESRCIYYNQPKGWRASFKPCFKTGGDVCNAIKGGKRCFATYCGDLAPALISLNASVCLISKEGEREIPLEAIFTGNGTTPFSLRRGELLKEVIIPSSKTIGGYRKLRMRNSIDYPLASVAISSDEAEQGRLVVGAVNPHPLSYEFSSYRQLKELFEKAYDDAAPVGNMDLSPLYRKWMIRVFVQELLKGMM